MPRLPFISAALAAALALAACDKPPAAPAPVRAVKLMTVAASAAVVEPPEYAGEVRAEVESRLGFRVAGKITGREVEPGQHVKKGQLLARLDARDYQLAADAAHAQVASALAQRDLAAADLERFSALRDKGFISSAELDRRSTALQAAESTLKQARAQLAAQGNQAGYTQLLADADGVVTGVDAEAGQVVAAGTPVVRLARDGARDVAFAVPEGQAQRLAVGQPVAVRLWAGDEKLTGRIREVAASPDPATRTYTVKAALQGQAAGSAPLGATAYVTPEGAANARTGTAVRLPTSALWQAADGQSAVWLFDAASGTVRQHAVQVSGMQGADVLIGSGLEAGMQVVASGVHALQQGQKVSIYKPKTGAEEDAEKEAHRPQSPEIKAGAAIKNVADGASEEAAAKAR